MKTIKLNKSSTKYLNKILDNHPNLSSGRKNYSKFENRIIKNILLTKLMNRKKNLDSFNKSQPIFKITKKIAKIIYK